LFKEILFRFKGQGDYALHAFFSVPLGLRMRLLTGVYDLVLAPSSEALLNKRGFSPLGVIFKGYKNIYTPFYKTSDIKQALLPLHVRHTISDHLQINLKHLPPKKPHRKIIIVDDLITSGETIRHLHLLLQNHGYEVKFAFTFATTQRLQTKDTNTRVKVVK
jgi:predicted amidophosphoribosyltransferase